MTRRSDARGRGFFGVGIERGKDTDNVGTLWRSAYAFGAAFIFTIGQRYPKQATDTTVTWRHVPLLEYTDVADFHAHTPYDCQIVGVEIHPQARLLDQFIHPERAIYLLGPEDGSLSEATLRLCQHVVQIDTRFCLNVASAGTVVMYDRQTKATRQQERLP